MSESDAGEQDMDLATVTRDEALLDALGRGEVPSADDVAVLLAAWRADLAADLPAGDFPAVRPPVPAAAPAGRAARPHRFLVTAPRRGLVAAAAALVLIAGGLLVGAAGAGPDSPLWPITRTVFQERAEQRVALWQAERAIAQARDAVAENRYPDAARLLDQATVIIHAIRDQRVAERLRGEVQALRSLLPPGVVGLLPTGPAGATPGVSGGPNPGGSPGTGGNPGLPLPGVTVPGAPSADPSPSGLLPSGLLPSGLLPPSILPPLLGG